MTVGEDVVGMAESFMMMEVGCTKTGYGMPDSFVGRRDRGRKIEGDAVKKEWGRLEGCGNRL